MCECVGVQPAWPRPRTLHKRQPSAQQAYRALILPPKKQKKPARPREQQFPRDCINDLAGRQAACNDSFSLARFRPSSMSVSNPALTLLSLSLSPSLCYLGFCIKIHLFRAAGAHAKPLIGPLDLIPSAGQFGKALCGRRPTPSNHTSICN